MLPFHHARVPITVHPRFVVKYVGCENVSETDSDAAYRDKLKKIHQKNAAKVHHSRKMLLCVTDAGVSLKCVKTGRDQFFAVSNISNCVTDSHFPNFVLMTYKRIVEVPDLECHVFMCGSGAKAKELREAMFSLFSSAEYTARHYQKSMENLEQIGDSENKPKRTLSRSYSAND